MEWKEPKSNVAVKLPQDLHRTVRSVATSKGKTAEAAYQEALEAWLKGGDKGSNGPVPVPVESLDLSVVKSTYASKIEPGEELWVNRLLRILRSKKPGLALAIQSNLMQFEDTDTLWAMSDERQGGADAQPSAIAGDASGAGNERAKVAPIGGSGSGFEGVLEHLDRTLDEIEGIKEGGREGKKRPHGKTGSGS